MSHAARLYIPFSLKPSIDPYTFTAHIPCTTCYLHIKSLQFNAIQLRCCVQHIEIDIHTFDFFFSVSIVVDGRRRCRPSRCCLLMKIESFNLWMLFHRQQKWRQRKRLYSLALPVRWLHPFYFDDVFSVLLMMMFVCIFFFAISLVSVMYCQAKWIFIRIHIGFGCKNTLTYTRARARETKLFCAHTCRMHTNTVHKMICRSRYRKRWNNG